MRITMPAAAISPALALALIASPVAAQDADAPADAAPIEQSETRGADGERMLQSMAEQLSDPERQEQLAMTMATLSEVLLDLPLAPILQPLSQAAGDTTDKPMPEVDPDATLRTLAPQASELPAQIQEKLPEAMSRMAGLSEGLSALLPALAAMGEQLRDRLPKDFGRDLPR